MSLPVCPNCQSDYTYQEDELFICPMCFYEWTSETVLVPAVKDINGNELSEGDSVTVVKDLKIKGAPVLKQNTVIKNIQLRPDQQENVICKLSTHGTLYLKGELLKKI